MNLILLNYFEYCVTGLLLLVVLKEELMLMVLYTVGYFNL